MTSEVYVQDLQRDTTAEPGLLVRDESHAFLAGEVPWEAEPPPPWQPPALVFGVSAFGALVSVLALQFAGGFGLLLVVCLLGMVVSGAVALGRWSIRSSPALPTNLISGSVAKLGVPSRVGSQTVFVEFTSPETGLTHRASYKTTSSEAGRLGIGPGAVMYVLYFDENRTLVL